ncbi:hypothetical protein SPB21_33700 [Leptothoe sp. ISB3NOV94-8A]|uniref:Uncharacterized protein n=1 Tax=Adonisia turfae CCMR0081 TaxID=2292702 RepID=A0A6M0RRP5_9CYAN|nr:hypothetical protein [Adonisia turfae]NEZ58473.1 hypothetical protein [Adonisia turfae CCMR0081]
MAYAPYTYGYALDTDNLDDEYVSEPRLDSQDDSNTPVLLNGMTILFERAVPVSPIRLIPKAQLSQRRR